ncbi:MAG: IscS subfamily cysteine desulfurase [Patescibacteria group bacterium]|jgi:cysteine desulfurase
MPIKKVYLDNAATTPMDPEVLKAMMPFLKDNFGNASSLHYAGIEANRAVNDVQEKIGRFLGCLPEEVYFTSGATESDNMAVLGLTEAILRAKSGFKAHIVVSAMEHDAILEPAQQLQKEGVEVTYLKPNEKGLIEIEKLRAVIKDNTVLVSIMYVNNEIGTIQPIVEIGKLIKELNEKRASSAKASAGLGKIYFHTDATQATAYCDMNVGKLGVDMLSLSAHKIYGPKGVGVFFLKQGTPFRPLIWGGHQQNGIRSGTYNVAGIVGLGKAIELIAEKNKIKQENKKIKELRDYLIKGIKKNIKRISINGDLTKRVPSNVSIIFEGVEGESVLLMLSQKGIAVSTGSACSSGSLEPSHVLKSIGVKPELAHGSIRFSLGRFSTKSDIDFLLRELPPIIKRLRAMSPLK